MRERRKGKRKEGRTEGEERKEKKKEGARKERRKPANSICKELSLCQTWWLSGLALSVGSLII